MIVVVVVLAFMNVALLAALWLERRDLHALRELAKRIRGGDYRARAALTGTGPVARVGHEFNAMAEALEISHRRLADEDAMRDALIDSLDEGVALVDAVDRVLVANPAWYRLLGIADVDQQCTWYECLSSVELDAGIAAVRQGGRASQIRVEHQRRHLDVRIVASRDDAVVFVLRDVTTIWEGERRRRDFLAAVSHEFKTPLTAIAGFSEMLCEPGALDERDEAIDAVRRIARHAERMRALVTDILALARIEDGIGTLRMSPLDCGAFIREVVDDHRDQAAQRKIAIAVDAERAGAFECDRDVLRQVLGNLLSNAIRYNQDGGSIDISAQRLDGREMRICVEDTGIGIPPEFQDRVFERFVRVDSHRNRAVGGTGLGLAIVRESVHALRGTVRLRSSSAGTAVTVVLPISPAV